MAYSARPRASRARLIAGRSSSGNSACTPSGSNSLHARKADARYRERPGHRRYEPEACRDTSTSRPTPPPPTNNRMAPSAVRARITSTDRIVASRSLATTAAGSFGNRSAAAKSFPPPLGKMPITTPSSIDCSPTMALTIACTVPSPPIANSSRAPFAMAARTRVCISAALVATTNSVAISIRSNAPRTRRKFRSARPAPAAGFTNTTVFVSRRNLEMSRTDSPC